MRKVVRLSVVLCLILCMSLPVAGVINAQSSDCNVQSGVLIGTLAYGVNCLDGDGWSGFEIESSGIPVSSLDDVAVCPDDQSILVLHIFGINKFDGTSWSDVEVPSEVFAPNALACAAGGEIWVAHTSGVSHFDDSEWTSVADDELGTSPFIIGAKDVAASVDGSVWVTTSNSVAHYVDGAWEIFENGKGFNEDYNLGDLVLNSDGLPIIAYYDGLLTYDGSSWSTESAPITLLQKVMVDNAGRVWVGSLSEGAAVLDDGNWTVYNVELGLSSNTVNALASDAEGRIWVGTGWGLNVLDSGEWTAYQMSNSDLLDNNVQHIMEVAELNR
jgi:ligand-binding sensor domain-containing protein